MNTQEISTEVVQLLEQIPEAKAQEIWFLLRQAIKEALTDTALQSHYAALLAQRQAQELSQDLTYLAAHGGAFDWLHDEPELYSAKDAKDKY